MCDQYALIGKCSFV